MKYMIPLLLSFMLVLATGCSSDSTVDSQNPASPNTPSGTDDPVKPNDPSGYDPGRSGDLIRDDLTLTCATPCAEGTMCRDGVCVLSLDRLPPHSTTGNSWTVLVFMAADNNLEAASFKDMQELMAVGSTTGLNLVVQHDRSATFTDDADAGVLGSFTSTKRFLVKQNSVEEISDLGELNTGTAEALADFISWGVGAYPADRTALVFWDHGAAWPGFGIDEGAASPDMLSLAEMRQGIYNGMTAAGLQRFALIGFDACLMATYEVAMAMAPFSEYLVASEELVPGHGWDYRSFGVLATNPSTSPLDLGKALVAGFAQQAQERGQSNTVTQSVIDLNAMPRLEAALQTVLSKLGGQMANGATAYSAKRSGATAYGSVVRGEAPEGAYDPQMIDLGEFILGAGVNFSAETAVFSQALAAAVVTNHKGPARDKSTGLAIYFPLYASEYNSGYNRLQDVAVWRTFLDGYFNRRDVTITAPASVETPATPQTTGVDASGNVTTPAPTVPTSVQSTGFFTNPNHAGGNQPPAELAGFNPFGDAPWISADFASGAAARVVSGVFFGGLIENGKTIILHDSFSQTNGNVDISTLTTFSVPWMFMGFGQLTQGSRVERAYISLSSITQRVDETTFTEYGFFTGSIPLLYETADGREIFVLYKESTPYQSGMGGLEPAGETQSALYAEVNGGWAELQPEAGSKLYPLGKVLEGETTTWFKLTETPFDAAAEITYDMADIPKDGSRTLYIQIKLFDAQGNYDWVATTAPW
ncbi:MAG: hypothetical protein A2284_07495 [Deltaproteobacteria bacterium RIFOXYA12_FULL_61_11]|nr:MAG: hypothetical protein A2284_07495 [Deltaproteobacteria bacterium RIFOXYA12_FULL_61_11]